MPSNEITNDTYLTIGQPAIGEYKEKGSKFIAYAFPVKTMEEVKTALESVKVEHHKARHHCYAYRLGLNKMENYRANDDGEPSGTAGRPILGQIDSKGLSNIFIVVVRYFGGTKLGVSGLIRAYKTAACNALEEAEIVSRRLMSRYELHFAYEQMNEVMQLLKKHDIPISGQGYEEGKCVLNIQIAYGLAAQIIQTLKKNEGLEARFSFTD